MRALLVALAAALAFAAPAFAQPAWLAPVDLTAEVEGVSAVGHVAVADDGTVVVAWEQYNGSRFVVQVRRRPPGGSFGPVKTVSNTGNDADYVDVGIDRSGNATIAWQEQPSNVVRAVPWAAGAAEPGDVQTVSDASLNSGRPALAVAKSGVALLAWIQSNNRIRAAIRSSAASQFVNGSPISAGSLNLTIDVPAVAINDAGDAVVAWSRFPASGNAIVDVNDRPRGGQFAATGHKISSSSFGAGDATEPAVVIDGAGRETALWSADGVVQYAERVQGGPWSNPGPASTGGAMTPVAAVGDDGTVVAAWISNEVVQAAVRAPGGGWTQKGNLSGALQSGITPVVAVGGNGDAVVAWEPAEQEAVFARRMHRGGDFGPLEQAVSRALGQSRYFFMPDVGVDNEGNTAAVWTRDDNRNNTDFYTLQTAGFDAAPPALSASVPASGTVGSPVGMAAAASDRWSAFSVDWAFGDGAGASGAAVSHAFGAAGAFNVTVIATDAVGNASGVTRPLLVAEPPPPEGPPRIESLVKVLWGIDGERLYMLRLKVTRVPKGGKAELRCKRRGCPFERRASSKRRKRAITLFKQVKPAKAIGDDRRRFLAGQKLQLRVTAPGYIGKVVDYRLQKDKIPTGRTRCLPIGSKKPRKSC